MPLVSLRRRALFTSAAALAFPAIAQPARTSSGTLLVTQIHDVSVREQDVSKDFLIGARAAWQDINARGGLHGKPIQHAPGRRRPCRRRRRAVVRWSYGARSIEASKEKNMDASRSVFRPPLPGPGKVHLSDPRVQQILARTATAWGLAREAGQVQKRAAACHAH